MRRRCPVLIAATMPALNDPGLMRSLCCIGGRWYVAASRETITATDPTSGN